jgi:hypothetical protein
MLGMVTKQAADTLECKDTGCQARVEKKLLQCESL